MLDKSHQTTSLPEAAVWQQSIRSGRLVRSTSPRWLPHVSCLFESPPSSPRNTPAIDTEPGTITGRQNSWTSDRDPGYCSETDLVKVADGVPYRHPYASLPSQRVNYPLHGHHSSSPPRGCFPRFSPNGRSDVPPFLPNSLSSPNNASKYSRDTEYIVNRQTSWESNADSAYHSCASLADCVPDLAVFDTQPEKTGSVDHLGARSQNNFGVPQQLTDYGLRSKPKPDNSSAKRSTEASPYRLHIPDWIFRTFQEPLSTNIWAGLPLDYLLSPENRDYLQKGHWTTEADTELKGIIVSENAREYVLCNIRLDWKDVCVVVQGANLPVKTLPSRPSDIHESRHCSTVFGNDVRKALKRKCKFDRKSNFDNTRRVLTSRLLAELAFSPPMPRRTAKQNVSDVPGVDPATISETKKLAEQVPSRSKPHTVLVGVGQELQDDRTCERPPDDDDDDELGSAVVADVSTTKTGDSESTERPGPLIERRWEFEPLCLSQEDSRKASPPRVVPKFRDSTPVALQVGPSREVSEAAYKSEEPLTGCSDDQGISDGEMSFMASHSSADWVCDDDKLMPKSFVAALANKLVRHYLDCCQRGTLTCAPYGGSTQPSSTAASAASVPPSSSTSYSGSKPFHTGLPRGQSNLTATPHAATTKPVEPATVLYLACPYCKYDPARYSSSNREEREYQRCESAALTTIPYVKQHLYRHHKRPDYYCTRCFEVFDEMGTLNLHSRVFACQATTPRYEEKMTTPQFHHIKRRVVGTTDEAKWYGIYQVLFPGSPLPATPYMDSHYSASVQRFMEFLQLVGPEMAWELYVTVMYHGGPVPQRPATTRHVFAEAFALACPVIHQAPIFGQENSDPNHFIPPATTQESSGSETQDQGGHGQQPYGAEDWRTGVEDFIDNPYGSSSTS